MKNKTSFHKVPLEKTWAELSRWIRTGQWDGTDGSAAINVLGPLQSWFFVSLWGNGGTLWPQSSRIFKNKIKQKQKVVHFWHPWVSCPNVLNEKINTFLKNTIEADSLYLSDFLFFLYSEACILFCCKHRFVSASHNFHYLAHAADRCYNVCLFLFVYFQNI